MIDRGMCASRPRVVAARDGGDDPSWRRVSGEMRARARLRAAIAAVAAALLALAPLPGGAMAGVSAATPGTWTVTGSMAFAREGHTATLLPTGKVLVAGGTDCVGAPTYACTNGLASAELYDPGTGAWTATGSMHAARTGHIAILLTNGKVLVTGGSASGSYLASAELYDPATGAWATTGSMPTSGYAHAVLLPNGEVFVVVSDNATGTSSDTLYDPSTGTWSAMSSVPATCSGVLTLLPNGTVAAFGAGTCVYQYNPGANTWTVGRSTTCNSQGLGTAAPILLPSGKALLQCVNVDDALYDPTTGAVTATGSATYDNYGASTLSLLPNGMVLKVGGDGNCNRGCAITGAELYNPATGAWAHTGNLTVAREGQTATLLPNGTVLVAGGDQPSYPVGTSLASAELYTPAPVAPSTLFSDGFESGSFARWSLVHTAADGSATVQGATVKSGAYAARLAETATPGSLAYARAIFATPAHALTVSGDFYVAQEGAANANVPLLRLINTFGIRFVSVYRQNHDYDQLWIKDNAGYHRTAGTLPLYKWAHVTLRVVANGMGTSMLEVALDGHVVYHTDTGFLDAAGVSAAQIGCEIPAQTFTLYADNIVAQTP